MYRNASAKSRKAQKIFLFWNVVNFIALALGALVVALKRWIPFAPVISAVLLAAGAALTFWLRKSRLEQRSYRCRAVAESVKTLSWRYMMCAAPYSRTLDTDTASRRLNSVLHDIAKQEREIEAPEATEVTQKMQELRDLPVTERLKAYMNLRIGSQKKWYSEQSKKNAKKAAIFLYIAAGTQVLALIFSLLLIPYETELPDLVGVFSAVSASFLAWMQLKRHEDLSQAYLTAAKELTSIQGNEPEHPSDDDLSRYVIDSENAVSREHTLWLAKRTE